MPYKRGTFNGKTLDERLGMSTVDLGLSNRLCNSLEEHHQILYVGQLLKMEPDELLRIPNFGITSLREVYKKLEEWGFYKGDGT